MSVIDIMHLIKKKLLVRLFARECNSFQYCIFFFDFIEKSFSVVSFYVISSFLLIFFKCPSQLRNSVFLNKQIWKKMYKVPIIQWNIMWGKKMMGQFFFLLKRKSLRNNWYWMVPTGKCNSTSRIEKLDIWLFIV